MSKYKTTLFSLAFFASNGVFAQQLHHQMISSQGASTTTSSGFIIKQTVGQQSVSGNSQGDIIVQQGFQQTYWQELLKTAMTIQGSGWVYLSKSGLLKITPNQSYKTDILMPVDMWEHSFTDYIPAKDAKKKYLFGILKIINWSVISDRLNTK